MDNLTAIETFTQFLQTKQLRVTQERLSLVEEIMNTDGHFDADQLYSILRTKGTKASRATVYNTLDLLVQCGLISKYRFGDNSSRYEKAFGRPRHDHLICLTCGDIIEFVNTELDRLQTEVCEEHKFRFENSSLQIFGTCSKCQKK
ncbi:MAG: transcriptional repressor [Ignavibacteriae bacterium]|nr:transcriptional repressor [Ignavibacteriota bacterium]